MNTIIYGNHEEWYALFNNLAPVACGILSLFFCNRTYENSAMPVIMKNKSKKKMIFARGLAFFLVFLVCLLIFAVDPTVNKIVSNLFLGVNVDNFFSVVFETPFLVLILSFIMGLKPTYLGDMIGLASSVSLILFKIACHVAGCCYGLPYNGKFFNASLDEYQVPIQLIELICAVVIFVILITLFKFKKMNGKIMPLFFMLYTGSRFISEFWRGDFPPVLGKMTGYHISCIAGFIFGVLIMIISALFGKKIDAAFEKRYNASGEKIGQYFLYTKQNKPKSKLYSKPLNYCISAVVELTCYILLIEVIFKGLRSVYMYNALFNAIHMNSLGIVLSFIISTLVGIAVLFVLNKETLFADDSNKKSSLIKFVVASLIVAIVSAVIGSVVIASMVSKSINIIVIDIIAKLVTLVVSFILMFIGDKYFIHIDKKDYLG